VSLTSSALIKSGTQFRQSTSKVLFCLCIHEMNINTAVSPRHAVVSDVIVLNTDRDCKPTLDAHCLETATKFLHFGY